MGQAPPPQMVTPPTTVPPQSVGVAVGIAANPIYPDVAAAVPAKQVNTLATQVEPNVKPATPPPPKPSTPPPSPHHTTATQQPPPGVMSQSAPGLLFDPSIIGNVQVVTPVAPQMAPSPVTVVTTAAAASDSSKTASGT